MNTIKYKCGIDPTIPDSSDCTFCYIHCSRKDSCEYTCETVKKAKNAEHIESEYIYI